MQCTLDTISFLSKKIKPKYTKEDIFFSGVWFLKKWLNENVIEEKLAFLVN